MTTPFVIGAISVVSSYYSALRRSHQIIPRLPTDDPYTVRCSCGHVWSLLMDIRARHSCHCYACPMREHTPVETSTGRGLKICAYCDRPRANVLKRCEGCGATTVKELK